MSKTVKSLSVLLLSGLMYIHYIQCMHIPNHVKKGKNDRYFLDLRGQKCQFCAPGYYMKKSCSITSGPSVCEPCPDGYYMDRPNNDTACYQCSYDCAFDQLTKLKNCTKLHDVICHCPDRMYFVPLQGGEGDGICYVCDTCSQDEQISKNCTHWNNIECLPSNKSSSSGSTPRPSLFPSTPPHSQPSTPSPSPTSNTTQPPDGGYSNNQSTDYIIIVLVLVVMVVVVFFSAELLKAKSVIIYINNAPITRRRRKTRPAYAKAHVKHIDISSSSSESDDSTSV